MAPACALAVADVDGAAPAGRTSAVHSYVVPVRSAGWRRRHTRFGGTVLALSTLEVNGCTVRIGDRQVQVEARSINGLMASMLEQ